MTRSSDILFLTEYVKNVLYFATVRQGKVLKSNNEIDYFCIDDELVYENYYSDFGPLNLGCVYKYCKIVNEKLKLCLNKQSIVHYTSTDAKKKANAAFLIGCYGVLFLNLTPRDALKPLTLHGQGYRLFQDATQGESMHTISLMDCLQAIKKARDLGFFNFSDFNYEEYQRLDKIQGGDLNWIVPGKFLAFIGPVDYSVSLHHPPEMYINYFRDNNVQIVIRLNKRMYDCNVFNSAGITHYDLFFLDGSCPPRHILLKFLQISEDCTGALAVHCKAGLGRTGSLIGCYLIKHYRMTAHEAIGWMRICRPGSVIGHQQTWLEHFEPWLMKQGNIYRKRTFQDTEKLPLHEHGIYSIAEKAMKQRPVVFSKSISPPPPIQRHTRSETTPPVRPQASRTKEEKSVNEDEEIFITACDLTTKPSTSMTQMKGCVIKNNIISEQYDLNDPYLVEPDMPFWKKYFCCQCCIEILSDSLWMMAVALNKTAEKEQYEWRVRSLKSNSQKMSIREFTGDTSAVPRRGSGAGEPRPPARPPSSSYNNSARLHEQRSRERNNDTNARNIGAYPPISTFRTTQGPVMKTINDARNFLIRSSLYNENREKNLHSSVTVTPQYQQISNCYPGNQTGNSVRHAAAPYIPVPRGPTQPQQPQQRRRLGRSPSPSPSPSPTRFADYSRATNTPPISALGYKYGSRDSKSALRDALSRLKSMPRDGSIGAASVGAASLGARRDAPRENRAPSVRSDERPIATQGDMLNSIKFQRQFRDSLNAGRIGAMFQERVNLMPKDKPLIREVNSKTSIKTRPINDNSLPSTDKQPIRDVNSKTSTKKTRPINDYSCQRERINGTTSRNFFSPTRPSSPKPRRSTVNTHSFY